MALEDLRQYRSVGVQRSIHFGRAGPADLPSTNASTPSISGAVTDPQLDGLTGILSQIASSVFLTEILLTRLEQANYHLALYFSLFDRN